MRWPCAGGARVANASQASRTVRPKQSSSDDEEEERKGGEEELEENWRILQCKDIYACKNCGLHITAKKHVKEKGYSVGGGKKGYLFEKAVNLIYEDSKRTKYTSGWHQSSKVNCKNCHEYLGWK